MEYDPTYRDRLQDDAEVHVEHDTSISDDGYWLDVRRTVWKKIDDRKEIVWQETVLRVHRQDVPVLVKDIVSSLVD